MLIVYILLGLGLIALSLAPLPLMLSRSLREAPRRLALPSPSFTPSDLGDGMARVISQAEIAQHELRTAISATMDCFVARRFAMVITRHDYWPMETVTDYYQRTMEATRATVEWMEGMESIKRVEENGLTNALARVAPGLRPLLLESSGTEASHFRALPRRSELRTTLAMLRRAEEEVAAFLETTIETTTPYR